MKVYCDDNDELLDVEDTANEEDAAREAHSRCETSEEDGCRGHYRVELPNGNWVRVEVVTRVEVSFDATFKGECPAPKLGTEEEG